jgi:hypothetical protein
LRTEAARFHPRNLHAQPPKFDAALNFAEIPQGETTAIQLGAETGQ